MSVYELGISWEPPPTPSAIHPFPRQCKAERSELSGLEAHLRVLLTGQPAILFGIWNNVEHRRPWATDAHSLETTLLCQKYGMSV